MPDLDFEDVIYPKTSEPFKFERKVDHFQMTYQSFKDLSIEAKLSYNFNWFGDYSLGGFTAKKGDKHYFDLFLKIKSNSDPKKQFTTEKFLTKEEKNKVNGKEITRNLEWIEFSASLSFSLKGKDDVSEKSVNKFLSTFANNTEGYSSDINLFIYLEYLIKKLISEKFLTKEEKNKVNGKEITRNLEWIEFSASLSWLIKGKDDVSQKSVKQFLSSYANNTSGYSRDINLFIYLEYLIK
nr:hypothetical protein [Mycoplasmoides pneumoniae]